MLQLSLDQIASYAAATREAGLAFHVASGGRAGVARVVGVKRSLVPTSEAAARGVPREPDAEWVSEAVRGVYERVCADPGEVTWYLASHPCSLRELPARTRELPIRPPRVEKPASERLELKAANIRQQATASSEGEIRGEGCSTALDSGSTTPGGDPEAASSSDRPRGRDAIADFSVDREATTRGQQRRTRTPSTLGEGAYDGHRL